MWLPLPLILSRPLDYRDRSTAMITVISVILAIVVVVGPAITAATAAIAVTTVTVEFVELAGRGRQEPTALTARAAAVSMQVCRRRTIDRQCLLLRRRRLVGNCCKQPEDTKNT